MNILAIDQGTSATKALLVGPGAEVLGRGEVPVGTRSVGADGVEADPEELFASVLAAGRRALTAAGAAANAVALANQGETVLAGTAAPAGRCPPRSSGRIAGRGASARGSRTARPSWPRSPACRWTRTSPRRRWPGCGRTSPGRHGHHHRHLAAGPAGRGVRDRRRHRVPHYAARPGLGGVVRRLRGVRPGPGALPAVADCAGIVGETSAFGPSLPVAGIAVDQQAALLAQRCLTAGDAKCTYGTGAFLLVTTGPRRYGPARGCPARWPGGSAARSRTAWTARSTRRVRRCAGSPRSAYSGRLRARRGG